MAGIRVANRTWDRAVEVAGRLGGEPVRLDDLPRHLAEVDVLLTSTGASAAILEHGDLASVVGERHGRELLVVDIAVPLAPSNPMNPTGVLLATPPTRVAAIRPRTKN